MSNITILVVEDEPNVLDSVTDLLTVLGYKTLSAKDATLALEMLETDKGIDILLTDIIMPGPINGIELARKALDIRPDLKVVYTSGYPEDKISKDIDFAVPEPLLVKPYTMKELDDVLTDMLT